MDAVRLLTEAWTEEDAAVAWSRFQERFSALVGNISRVVVAPQRTIHLALLGLFSQGHVLLEDLPGVGKTLLAKTIASSIAGRFSRIQFTPDLLPTDITGSSIFDLQQSKFEFVPGPIFANIVLADEVNRTGPRTQSALLEAMGEHQVTADGALRPLPQPFMVIATQNTIESYGTFPLPNSQLDRFAISMNIGLPTPREEMEILTRSEHGLLEVSAVLSAEDVVEMQRVVRRVQVAEPIKQYLVNLAGATREHPAVLVGVSPRAAVSLLRAAQGWAAFEGRDFVVPEDVKEVAISALSHRVLVDRSARVDAKDIIGELLNTVRVPL